MTLKQESAIYELLREYNRLSKEVDPYSFADYDIEATISVWEQFKENYTEACKNIREEVETIKSENEDYDIIVELADEMLEQLEYMEAL